MVYAALSLGVNEKSTCCLVLSEVADLYGTPFLVTRQTYSRVVGENSPSSLPNTVIGEPSRPVAGAPRMAAGGSAPRTYTASTAPPTPPSSSVTRTPTTYTPAAAGV